MHEAVYGPKTNQHHPKTYPKHFKKRHLNHFRLTSVSSTFSRRFLSRQQLRPTGYKVEVPWWSPIKTVSGRVPRVSHEKVFTCFHHVFLEAHPAVQIPLSALIKIFDLINFCGQVWINLLLDAFGIFWMPLAVFNLPTPWILA